MSKRTSEIGKRTGTGFHVMKHGRPYSIEKLCGSIEDLNNDALEFGYNLSVSSDKKQISISPKDAARLRKF